jgi:hypothetical protein
VTPESKTADYATLATEAESAVAAVKDPELRRVAFEKILATLIEQRFPTHGPSRAAQKSQVSPRVNRDQVVKRTSSKAQGGPKGYVEELISEGFFKEQRTIAQVKAELANGGRHIALTSLSGPLQKLTQERRLRRQKIVTNGEGTKAAYAYSNW